MAETATLEAGAARMLRARPAEAWQALLPALQRLDALLSRAVERAREVYTSSPAGDQFRGLYIGDTEVDGLLERPPGEPILASRTADTLPEGPLWTLADVYGLTGFDLDVVMLGVAPTLDRRYERLYAYLQDNVTRHYPTVDLALNLLCTNAAERIECRRRFGARSPLVANGVIRLMADGANPSLLAASFSVGNDAAALLAGDDPLDAWTWPGYRVVREGPRLDELPLGEATRRGLASALEELDDAGPLAFYLHGADATGQETAAAAIAGAAGRPLAVLDLSASEPSGEVIERLFRCARLGRAVPFIAHCESIGREHVDAAAALAAAAAGGTGGLVILGGRDEMPPAGIPAIPIECGTPGAGERSECWRRSLSARGLLVDEEDLEALGGRLKLRAGDIDAAVGTAIAWAQWEQLVSTGSAQGWALAVDGLFEAARGRGGRELAELTRRVRPHARWDDLVLPPDTRQQLWEICERVIHRGRVLDEWGFDERLSLGKGTTVLFSGPAGTGKTMAAEVLARELRLDLYKVDLSGVVSKYIGETEKNLGRIFAAAEDANAILFFDEADALFGKRSEVRDSHDRYANIEISFLLQKMEEYDGVAILATNLRQNLDESFVRRLAFSVHFPFPDEVAREEIWRHIWPAATPVADDLDLAGVSRTFKLSGGNIKNVALAAAFSAASDGAFVRMDHVLHATRREFQKLGKTLSDTELAMEPVGGDG